MTRSLFAPAPLSLLKRSTFWGLSLLLLGSLLLAGCGQVPLVSAAPGSSQEESAVVQELASDDIPVNEITVPDAKLGAAGDDVVAATAADSTANDSEANDSEENDSEESAAQSHPPDGSAAESDTGDPEPQVAQPVVRPTPVSNQVNVLILGSDRRPNEPNWRTDVIMLLLMDFTRGTAGVISLPRDLYLEEIPEHRPNRINVVDYLGEQDQPNGGGPALLAQILEERLELQIDHYLRFDFASFKEVVDALGGVVVEIDCTFNDYLIEEDIALRLTPGPHRLNGRDALAYVRSRHQGGDLDRVRRQQRMLWAVRQQIERENMLPKAPALYAALHDAVQTDIGPVDAIRFARFALSLSPDSIHGRVIDPPAVAQGWRQGMFVFLADWDLIDQQIQTVFDRAPLLETNTVGEMGDRNVCP